MNFIHTGNYIYEHLMDEESKIIFKERLLWSVSHDTCHIRNIINTLPEGRTFSEFIDNAVSFFIWGGGIWGKDLALVYRNKCSGFIDSDKSKQGMSISGLKVLSPAEALPHGGKIVIGTRLYYEEIRSQAMSMGISDEDIINAGEVIDELSKRQYFSLKELPHDKDEVFIDVGCFDGTTSIEFTRWSNSFNKIWCFEPDKKNVLKCKKKLESLIRDGKAEIIAKGAWSGESSLKFSETMNGASKFSSDGENSVDVTSIDSILAGKRPTFIKMDIEGAELEALKGARNCITENKPKLAICVYHKLEDIVELPQLILDMNPDYRLYLRHYSLSTGETVLYAI